MRRNLVTTRMTLYLFRFGNLYTLTFICHWKPGFRHALSTIPYKQKYLDPSGINIFIECTLENEHGTQSHGSLVQMIFLFNQVIFNFKILPSLKLTAKVPENGRLVQMYIFLFGAFRPIFNGKLAVSFREGQLHRGVIQVINFTGSVLPQALQHLIQQLLTKATALRGLLPKTRLLCFLFAFWRWK